MEQKLQLSGAAFKRYIGVTKSVFQEMNTILHAVYINHFTKPGLPKYSAKNH
jgi:hypothetical protein